MQTEVEEDEKTKKTKRFLECVDDKWMLSYITDVLCSPVCRCRITVCYWLSWGVDSAFLPQSISATSFTLRLCRVRISLIICLWVEHADFLNAVCDTWQSNSYFPIFLFLTSQCLLHGQWSWIAIMSASLITRWSVSYGTCSGNSNSTMCAWSLPDCRYKKQPSLPHRFVLSTDRVEIL